MEPDDYCDIFCSHLMVPRHHTVIGDFHRFVRLANGDGLGFGRVERYHDIHMNNDSFIFHFDYLPFPDPYLREYIIVGFRLVLTVHTVDDLEIEEDCM